MWAEWKNALKSTRFRIHFILAVLGIVAFASSLPYFFNVILLPKPGVRLNDPVLRFFEPKDWSVEIFVLLYLITIMSLALNINKPKTLLVMFQTYAVVNFMRMVRILETFSKSFIIIK